MDTLLEHMEDIVSKSADTEVSFVVLLFIIVNAGIRFSYFLKVTGEDSMFFIALHVFL